MAMTRQMKVYRCCTPVVDTEFDPDGRETLTNALVDALAEAEDVNKTAIPPLYDAVDLDALSQLFESHEQTADSGTVLSFTFDSWNVFVRADGRIRVCDASRPTEPEPVFSDPVA